MTFHEYNALSEAEMYNVVWDQGAVIADRREKGFSEWISGASNLPSRRPIA